MLRILPSAIPSYRRGTSCLSGRMGYVALLSVLLVSVIAATTILILFITSTTSTLNSGDVMQAKAAKAYAEACAETGLQRVTDGKSVPCNPESCPLPAVNFTSPNGTCTVVNIYGIDAQTFRIRATGKAMQQSLTKYIEVKAFRDSQGVAATVQSWEECVDFAQPITSDCQSL
jgi:hypothetical protein